MLPASDLRTPRRLAVLITLVAVSLSLFQCKKSDDPEPVGGDTNLVASWKMTQYGLKDSQGVVEYFDEISGQVAPCLYTQEFIFAADGGVKRGGRDGCALAGVGSTDELIPGSGGSKWQTAGTKLTILKPDGSKADFTYELSGMTLRLEALDRATGRTHVFLLKKP
ncbi:MAG: hypothetical protein H7Y12_00185 [Sphingobacteriaceae bacterium]|nr:hypothetical protein [Cytophagaceae bacterium]